jgi:hypothetical protein
MTNCTGIPAEQRLESYLQGTLPEDEARQFEEHYFDCPTCLAQVEALQAVALKLGIQPRKALLTPIPWRSFVATGAIAALLILGFLDLRLRRQSQRLSVASGLSASIARPRPSPPPAPSSLTSSPLSRLADLTLPAFEPPTLRGESTDSHFDEGMKAYANRDCPGAVRALSLVPAQDENGLAALFYSGVCQMHEGDKTAASLSLRRVARAGDTPQQEAAWYYLAQIALVSNDTTTARHYLSLTISLHGDFQRRARKEVASIPMEVGQE